MITKEYDLEDRLTDPNLRRQRSHREEPQFERWALSVQRWTFRSRDAPLPKSSTPM